MKTYMDGTPITDTPAIRRADNQLMMWLGPESLSPDRQLIQHAGQQS